MCDMMTIGGKDNGLDPGNRISTLMSSALDLWPFYLKINTPMSSMVTLGGKGNVLELRLQTDRRTDGQPDSSIPPQLRCEGYKNKFTYQSIFKNS
jgi:hypothetical protein